MKSFVKKDLLIKKREAALKKNLKNGQLLNAFRYPLDFWYTHLSC